MRKVVLGLSLALMSLTANAQFNCKNIMDTDGVINIDVDELAKEARLPDDYMNRYQIDVIYGLCKGDESGFHELVDMGYVKRSEIEALRETLGLEKRSERGRMIELAESKISDLGFDTAQTQNMAQVYVDKPNSQCARLTDKAIQGNEKALQDLIDNDDICEIP